MLWLFKKFIGFARVIFLYGMLTLVILLLMFDVDERRAMVRGFIVEAKNQIERLAKVGSETGESLEYRRQSEASVGDWMVSR